MLILLTNQTDTATANRPGQLRPLIGTLLNIQTAKAVDSDRSELCTTLVS